jgi:hypothetical protein
VTPKTVELHPRNAYRKLGIGSRRELPAELATPQPRARKNLGCTSRARLDARPAAAAHAGGMEDAARLIRPSQRVALIGAVLAAADAAAADAQVVPAYQRRFSCESVACSRR